jgi:isopenicillin N synthase-like dioxygenase
VKAPPQPPDDRRTALAPHTDFGSVTVLFNRVGGLQVRLPQGVDAIPPATQGQMSVAEKALCEDGWTYVRPLPGHAIINLGDAMVKFSAGILRSNTHRVVAPPGAQGDVTRYSLVYFSRPEDEVLLRPLRESPLIDRKAGNDGDGEVIKSKDWIIRRALGRRVGKYYNPDKAKGTEDARGARG